MKLKLERLFVAEASQNEPLGQVNLDVTLSEKQVTMISRINRNMVQTILINNKYHFY